MLSRKARRILSGMRPIAVSKRRERFKTFYTTTGVIEVSDMPETDFNDLLEAFDSDMNSFSFVSCDEL